MDISGRTISINQTIAIDNRSLHVKGPKSENGYRTIELHPVTFRQLCRHRTKMVKERVAAGDQYQRTPLGLDLEFRGDHQGGPLRPDRLTRAFKREWAHAGLVPGPTLHGLRHTNGSLLLLKGVPPIDVAAHLGQNLQTLNKVYAHELDPANRQERVAEAIGSIFG